MNKLNQALIRQFGNPNGLLGVLAGHIMATRKSNLQRNEWTLRLLELQTTDQILEIGPGPGVTLQKILAQVTGGKVVALDHSRTMLGQCRRRNHAARREGRLLLIEGDYVALGEIEEQFDKIVAVNSLQFDGINEALLTNLHKLLKPGGRLAITFQPRGKNPTNEAGHEFASDAGDRLMKSGFETVNIKTLELQPVHAFCVLATVT